MLYSICKASDRNTTDTKYEIFLDGKLYTSGVSEQLKNIYVEKFKQKGYNQL